MNVALSTGWRCARCSAASAWRTPSMQQARVAALAVPRRHASHRPVNVRGKKRSQELPQTGKLTMRGKVNRFELLMAKAEDPGAAMKHVVQRMLDEMQRKLGSLDYLKILGVSTKEAHPAFQEFRNAIEARMAKWPKNPEDDKIFQRLRDARAVSGDKLRETLTFWIQHQVVSKRLVGRPMLVQRMKELGDMRNPFEWFPITRRIKRKIHLHIGPTNSGKTYHALKRLEQAGSGLYAGPLRLLAREVYQRLNAAGKPCRLKTGDEALDPPGSSSGEIVRMQSCTVEMTPLESPFDVAVIDEIQMIADEDRGSAWTMALLGIAAPEIHLCGEERTHDLIQDMCEAIGDDFEVHRYERLSPLEVQHTSLNGNWGNLKKGDCVVGFSVKMLHALRTLIERQTRKKVAIVYGSLPPEIRTQQAALFNDPDSGYDFLVASDAIGMGLNLNIRRVIFYTTQKRSQGGMAQIEYPAIKQIAGRAGRFRVAPPLPTASNDSTQAASPAEKETPVLETAAKAPLLGLVSTLQKEDLILIRKAMSANIQPLTHAGIIPTEEIFLQFCNLFQRGTPFSYILLRFYTTVQLHPMFKMKAKRDVIKIADLLQVVSGLNNRDKLIFVHAPIGIKDEEVAPYVLELAKCVSESRPGHILELPGLKIELLDRQGPATFDYLSDLETLHHRLVLYNWLSFRFEAIFETRALATHLKSLVEDRIARSLFELGGEFNEQLKREAAREKKKRLRAMMAEMEAEDDDGELEPSRQPSSTTNSNEAPRAIDVHGNLLPLADTVPSSDLSLSEAPIRSETASVGQ